MNKRTGIVRKWVIGLMVLMVLFVSGPAWAQGAGATQGSVALNLASVLGLSLPSGATAQDAINALSALGITPATGWNAGGAADDNFIAALYSAVLAAFNAGSITPAGGQTPAEIVAAACTAAGIPRSDVVNAITGAGGNGSAAERGATYGPANGPGNYGPSFDGSRPGSGGGGGGVNPSPNE